METYFRNMVAEDGTKEKLAHDLMTLIHDAEDLLKATGGDLAEKSKGELLAAFGKLKVSCKRLEQQAIASSRATEQLIRDHPLPALGIAFSVGLLIGVLCKRC